MGHEDTMTRVGHEETKARRAGHEGTKTRSIGHEGTKNTKQTKLSLCFVTFVILVSSWPNLCVFVAARQTQPSAAKRIISLVPALTEILFAIGAGPQVIAVSSYDDDPPEVLKLPRVGALLDPDTERILSMRPDLVLIYGSQDELQKQLEAAGIRAFSYRHGGLADVTPVIRQLGTLTGRSAEATRVAGEIETQLGAVRARVAGRPRPKTLLVMSREPRTLRNLDASGGLGFLHDMVELAGGANVFADVKRQAVRVSSEMLLTRAPEVIIDLFYSREMTAAQLQQEREAWMPLASVPAVRRNRIELLVGDYLVVPGPRIAAAAETFARAIHPEAFK
jgi:iron complex transport system substrate-binding protein